MSDPEKTPTRSEVWQRPFTAPVILGLGITIGLLAGFVDVVFRFTEPIRFGSLTRFPTYFVAIACAGNLLISSAIAVGLALVSRILRFLARPRFALPVLLLPLFLSLTFNALPRAASYASAILALGLATALARLMISILPRRLFSSWTVSGLGCVLLGLVLFFSYRAHQDVSPSLVEMKADTRGAKNVLVITLDTLRAANMSLYGYERPTTPQLEDFAKEALVFDRAYSTTSWTLPGHASLFTGLGAEETGTDWAKPLDAKHLTLAEAMHERGYETSGFVANLAYCTARSGLAQGFHRYEDHRIVLRTLLDCTAFGRFLDGYAHRFFGKEVPPYPGRKIAEELNDDFFGWLDGRDEDRPFFSFVNYFDVHQPYITPEPFHSRFDRKKLADDDRAVIRLAAQGEERFLDDMDRYDGAIAYLDDQLGRLFAGLEKRGLMGNTIIIITSDHGETFAEHKAGAHGTSLYPETIHVPLIIRLPDLAFAGSRRSEELTLRDLPKTLLTQLGFEEAAAFPGQNVLVASGSTSTPSPVLTHLTQGIRVPEHVSNHAGALRSLIVGSLQLIVHEDPKLGDEVYDLSRDPFARDNLIADPDYQERIADLRARYRELVDQP